MRRQWLGLALRLYVPLMEICSLQLPSPSTSHRKWVSARRFLGEGSTVPTGLFLGLLSHRSPFTESHSQEHRIFLVTQSNLIPEMLYHFLDSFPISQIFPLGHSPLFFCKLSLHNNEHVIIHDGEQNDSSISGCNITGSQKGWGWWEPIDLPGPALLLT